MSRAFEIYPYKRIIERELAQVNEDLHNAKIIQKYYVHRLAEGLSPARIAKCLSTIKLTSRMLNKPFTKVTKDDIIAFVAHVEQQPFSPWTKRDYKTILKKFYQWLRNCESNEYPHEVRWIKINDKVSSKLTKKHLLTTEEINRLVNAATNIRDKALILVLMESGRRIGDILTLRIEYVEFDEMGARLLVDGKTGTDFSRIIAAAPALATWLDNHPLRDDPSAPVWVGFGNNNRYEQLSYGGARSILKECVQRAGLIKRIYFHLFRHTRATQAATKLNQMQMCAMLGWKFSSKMPSVYVHLSGEDIDEAQSIMNGVEITKHDIPLLHAKVCARCSFKNAPSSKFCNKCGLVLDVETVIQMDEARGRIDELLNKLTENPEKLEKLLALIEG